MRKDVKIGLAVGIVLIGAVLVYIIIVAGSGGPSGGGAQLVTNTTDEGEHLDPNVDPPPVPPDPDHGSDDGTFDEHGAGQLAANTAAIADPPAPPPPAGFDWALALSGQSLPPGLLAPDVARSQTPTPPVVDSRYAIGSTIDPVAPTTRPTGRRLYTVQSGDSYWLITKQQYGDVAYLSHVMRANAEIPANKLRAGMTIILPDKAEVIPPALANSGSSGSSDIPGGANDPNAYTVQPGDSLYKIAVKFYGTPNYVEKIYEANRQVIGPDMAKVKAGMVLRLPDRPAGPAGTTSP